MKKTDLEMLTSYCGSLWTERTLKDDYPPSEDLLAAINRLASDANEPAITPLGELIEFTRGVLFGWDDDGDRSDFLKATEDLDAPMPSHHKLRGLYKELHEAMDTLISALSRYAPVVIGDEGLETMDVGQFQEIPPGGALINLSDFTWDCRNSATSRVLPVWVSTCPGSFFSVDLRAEAHLKRFERYSYWNLFLRFEPTESRPPTIADVILTDQFELTNGELTIRMGADDFTWLMSLREGI